MRKLGVVFSLVIAAASFGIGDFNDANAQGRASKRAAAAPALPAHWNHNGSRVTLVSEGARQKIVYEAPRIGLLDAGVKPGMVLFEGRRSGQTFVGKAYLFYRACKPRAYAVTGDAGNSGGARQQITLKGKAPLLDVNCNVIGARDDVLVFTALDQAPVAPPKDKEIAAAPVTGASASAPSAAASAAMASAAAASNAAASNKAAPAALPVKSEPAQPPTAPAAEDKQIQKNSEQPQPAGDGIGGTAAAAAQNQQEAQKQQAEAAEDRANAPAEPAKDTQVAALPANAPSSSASASVSPAGSASGDPPSPERPAASPAGEGPKAKEPGAENTQAQQNAAAPNATGADSAKETPKETAQDTAREPAKEPAKEAPKETAQDVAKEAPKELAQQASKDSQVAAQVAAIAPAAGAGGRNEESAQSKNASLPRSPQNESAAREPQVAEKPRSETENQAAPLNASEKMMEIVLKSGRILRIGRDVELETLSRLILLLER